MNYVVVKLSGGMVSPDEDLLNRTIIKGYVNEIRSFYEKPDGEKPRLVLLVGGGGTSRLYRDLAVASGEESDVDQHRIGMTATWLNAELIRSLLDEKAFQRVLGVGVYAENRSDAEKMMANDFETWLKSDIPVLVSGGFINGASTDFNAVLVASKLGVEMVHKLTDVDHVYTKDPKENEDAQPLERISWDEFFRMFGEGFETFGHKPGGHVPLDMFAARLASDNGITCLVTDGRDPAVIGEILRGGQVPGTVIHT